MTIFKILLFILAAFGAYYLFEEAVWQVHKSLYADDINELIDHMEKRDKNKK